MRLCWVSVLVACSISVAFARDFPGRDVSACSFGVSTGLCSLRPVGADHVCNPCDSRSYIQCNSEVTTEAHVLYCPAGKLFNPLTGSCDNAESVRLTCYDVISRPSAASQLAGATHWRITNWFTYQQDKACGFLGSIVAGLLRASAQCGKRVVMHSSGRSTTLTSTLDGQPAVVTTTTISSTSYEPRLLLPQAQPDSTTSNSVPHFLDPDTLPDGPGLSGTGLSAANLRGKQQQPTVVFHPDLAQLNSQVSKSDRDPAVPTSVLQQVIPRLVISSEAITEMLPTDRSVAGNAVAEPALESSASGMQSGAVGPYDPSSSSTTSTLPETLDTPANLVDPYSAAAAAAAEAEAAPEAQAGDTAAQDRAVELAVAEDAGSITGTHSSGGTSTDALARGGASHPFDSSDVVVPT